MHEVRLDPDPGIVREGAAISSLSKCSRHNTPSFGHEINGLDVLNVGD
jgi:hypothetical protein